MNQRTLEVLEYPRIREEIAGYCMSEEGRVALSSVEPRVDAAEVARLKRLGAAWLRALSAEHPPEFRGWPAVGGFLGRVRVEGATLGLEELLALGLFCDSVGAFRAWAESRDRAVRSGRRDSLSLTGLGAGSASGASSTALGSALPAADLAPSCDAELIARALGLADLSGPASEIWRVIDKSGELRDLSELRDIRQGIKRIRQDIERLVNHYLGDDALKPMLQSTLPTVRDGRQVIALRANFRGRVRGIVHEVSQSGQTVYVEPEDVVDRNNDLVTEEHRLSREIARILRELTARLAPFHDLLADSLAEMVFLDGIGAGARWGRDHKGSFANDRPPDRHSDETVSLLQLRQGRHPLLRERAVPIDLVLSPGARMLIITGPNTGGKTVSLKTVALFALMNQTGWPIPAAPETVLPTFDYVGCDIGDEQSLDQSLSTFSGHMKNIAGILGEATAGSLVLLDELGSGTDPQEGSAIAMAVLDSLLERGSTVLVTTHHGVLKNYGYTHPQCVNASVDFDQDTLSPTYRILMGVPGESHALDIASSRGLNGEIIERARGYLVSERADVSALIKGLTAKHEELDRFEKDKRLEERDLREKRRKSDLKELQLRQKELELREQGYRRLDHLFDESRKRLENLVRELREGELTREKTLRVKGMIAEFEAEVASEYAGLDAARSENLALRQAVDQRAAADAAADAEDARSGAAGSAQRATGAKPGRRAAARAASSNAEIIPEFAPGVEVYVGASRRRGTLVRKDKGDSWTVATGTLKLSVKTAELAAVPVNGQERKVSVDVHAEVSDGDTPAFELRLIGMRHDEAMKALERQLDLASMKGLKAFSIVHGKGTGVLQTAVHEALAAYSGVESWAFARPEDGGTGKTLVTMH